MRRRRFMGATAGLTGVLGLTATATACGGDPGDGDVVLKLVVTEFADLVGGGSVEQFWNDVAADFREINPHIRVEVSAIPYRSTYEEVARMIDDGNAPDIAQLYMFADFARAGELYDANDLLTIPVLSDFPSSIAAAGEVRRVQYGMPFVAYLQTFFWNKALFEDAGLDPDTPPRDLEELLDAAQALRRAGVEYPYGLALGHDDANGEALMWMLAGGGSLTDPTGSYTIDSPANVWTFTWLRDRLVGSGLTGPTAPGDTARHDLYQAFAAGRVGMLTGDPFLTGFAEESGVGYGTAAMPGRRGASLSVMGDASWLLGFRQRGNQEHIATFLTYLFTEHHNVSTFAERYRLLPVSTPAAQTMGESDSPENRRLRPFLDELPAATFLPAGKVSWATVARLISDGIGETVRPDGDVEGILARIQSDADTLDRQA
ncbi:ABC transporter substrate-binding protein [Streptomyces sp. URMC 129]|uniref:ABC transporter substrate-binding protein n=1 Tax=Streptomyces sp. URMC 129 TaxID=3423407 RepID=UPI003F1E3D5D